MVYYILHLFYFLSFRISHYLDIWVRKVYSSITMETYILDNILKMHFTTTEQEMAVQKAWTYILRNSSLNIYPIHKVRLIFSTILAYDRKYKMIWLIWDKIQIHWLSNLFQSKLILYSSWTFLQAAWVISQFRELARFFMQCYTTNPCTKMQGMIKIKQLSFLPPLTMGRSCKLV